MNSLSTSHRSRFTTFIPWLAFSTGWVSALLVFTQFRFVWLSVGGGLLFGFLTDCLVDVVAVRRHQRGLGADYRDKFQSGTQPNELGTQESTKSWTWWTRKRFEGEAHERP